MYNILDSFDIFADFFAKYPQLKIAFPDVDSNIMWAIALVIHPESQFRNLDLDERKEVIAKDYLQDPDLDFESKEIKPIVEKFEKLCLTKKMRILNDWETKLEERDQYLKTVKYGKDTVEFLDKAKKMTTELWKGYFAALKDVEEEAAVYVTGKSLESVSENHII